MKISPVPAYLFQEGPVEKKIITIAEKIAQGGRNLFFTGAGISTESGIPDYRSQGGIWDQFRPVTFDEFMSSRDARIEYWRQKTELYPDLLKARPNAGHRAIARLCDAGMVEAVITQNIDGLHQASGIPEERVIELHGNTTRVRCMSCAALSPLDEAQARIAAGDPAPACPCGGYLKPDTISFGQSMPETELARAVGLCQNCDLLCVVGSTLLVQPAAHLPLYARRNGAFLAIVNLSETPCDDISQALIRGHAGEVLTAVADHAARPA
jgi:NAD-dependent protein deacetylase/lipoamidase